MRLPTTGEMAQVYQSGAFRASNQAWNTERWNRSARLGPVAALLKAAQEEWAAGGGDGFLPAPVWTDYYFRHQLPMEGLYAYSQEFRAAHPEVGGSSDAWTAVCIRVLFQTYAGARAEHEAMAFLSAQFPGMEVRLTKDQVDRCMCVDLEVLDGGQLRYAFQLKPQSFFLGVRSGKNWAEQAVRYNREGHLRYQARYGMRPRFLFWRVRDGLYQFCSEERAERELAG